MGFTPTLIRYFFQAFRYNTDSTSSYFEQNQVPFALFGISILLIQNPLYMLSVWMQDSRRRRTLRQAFSEAFQAESYRMVYRGFYTNSIVTMLLFSGSDLLEYYKIQSKYGEKQYEKSYTMALLAYSLSLHCSINLCNRIMYSQASPDPAVREGTKNLFRCIRHVIKNEGVRGLLRGYSYTFLMVLAVEFYN